MINILEKCFVSKRQKDYFGLMGSYIFETLRLLPRNLIRVPILLESYLLLSYYLPIEKLFC